MSEKTSAYEKKAHFIGRVSILLAFIGTILFPITLIVFLKVPVDMTAMIAASTAILAIQIPSALSQFLSYAPLIGPSAMYTMVVTGNFNNMKIPSSFAAMEAVGLDPSNYTEESDVISTVAMATSTIVCEIIIILGVLLMSQLSGVLKNPILAPAFANVSPALFGALFAALMVKDFKLSIIPIVASVVIISVLKLSQVFITPLTIIISVISAILLYKMGLLSPKKEQQTVSENKGAK